MISNYDNIANELQSCYGVKNVLEGSNFEALFLCSFFAINFQFVHFVHLHISTFWRQLIEGKVKYLIFYIHLIPTATRDWGKIATESGLLKKTAEKNKINYCNVHYVIQ